MNKRKSMKVKGQTFYPLALVEVVREKLKVLDHSIATHTSSLTVLTAERAVLAPFAEALADAYKTAPLKPVPITDKARLEHKFDMAQADRAAGELRKRPYVKRSPKWKKARAK